VDLFIVVECSSWIKEEKKERADVRTSLKFLRKFIFNLKTINL